MEVMWYEDENLVDVILDYACENMTEEYAREVKMKCLNILKMNEMLSTRLIKMLYKFPEDPVNPIERKYGAERFFEKLFDKKLLDVDTLTFVFVSLWTTRRPYQYFAKEKLEQILGAVKKPMVDKYAKIDKLQSKMVIYRGIREREGCVNEDNLGYSWTLDKNVARKFATGDGQCCGYIYKGEIEQDKVVAYFNARWEEEIMVFPSDIKNIEKEFVLSADNNAN